MIKGWNVPGPAGGQFIPDENLVAARVKPMREPTLADAIIREHSRSEFRRKYDRAQTVAKGVAAARKFVLDESMSSFMADLAYAPLAESRDVRKDTDHLEGLRKLSRLPHALTWIEFDLKARARRAVEQYGCNFNTVDLPARGGWLLIQHATIETAFAAMECVSHTTASEDRESPLIPVPAASHLTWVWSTTDDPPPTKFDPRFDPHWVTETLTGLPGYRTPCLGVAPSTWVDPELSRWISGEVDMRRYLSELASDVRYLWSLLAAINDVPVERKEIRPTKGHLVGGNYKKFVEHTTISLRIPQKVQTISMARRITRAAIRKRHQVRGHWREDWRNPLSPSCEHDMNPLSTRLVCRRCSGHQLWVEEHERGDASLGFVLHDYSVQHPKEKTA